MYLYGSSYDVCHLKRLFLRLYLARLKGKSLLAQLCAQMAAVIELIPACFYLCISSHLGHSSEL